MPLHSSAKYHGHGDFTASEILDAFGKMIKAAIGHKGYEIVPGKLEKFYPQQSMSFGALDLRLF